MISAQVDSVAQDALIEKYMLLPNQVMEHHFLLLSSNNLINFFFASSLRCGMVLSLKLHEMLMY